MGMYLDVPILPPSTLNDDSGRERFQILRPFRDSVIPPTPVIIPFLTRGKTPERELRRLSQLREHFLLTWIAFAAYRPSKRSVMPVLQSAAAGAMPTLCAATAPDANPRWFLWSIELFWGAQSG